MSLLTAWNCALCSELLIPSVGSETVLCLMFREVWYLHLYGAQLFCHVNLPFYFTYVF